jgi:hypothetical protein
MARDGSRSDFACLASSQPSADSTEPRLVPTYLTIPVPVMPISNLPLSEGSRA